MDKKFKIVDIDNIQIITNGSISELSTIDNPNQVGSIFDNDNQKTVSQITPLIMLVNQNAINGQDKINALLQIGSDPHLKVNYNGKETSAFEIAAKYRTHFNL